MSSLIHGRTSSRFCANSAALEQNLDLYDDTAAVSVQSRGSRNQNCILAAGQEPVPDLFRRSSSTAPETATLAAMAGAAFDLSPQEQRQFAGYIVQLAGLKNVDENLSIEGAVSSGSGGEAGTIRSLG